MNDLNNFKDGFDLNLFGRIRDLAVVGKSCVTCGKPAADFRDEVSRKEFGISGLCQRCQDEFFVEPFDDEG